MITAIAVLLAVGRALPTIDRVFPVAQAAAAFRLPGAARKDGQDPAGVRLNATPAMRAGSSAR
jgi:hypothetical protein